jgi:hypothetical protein
MCCTPVIPTLGYKAGGSQVPDKPTKHKISKNELNAQYNLYVQAQTRDKNAKGVYGKDLISVVKFMVK